MTDRIAAIEAQEVALKEAKKLAELEAAFVEKKVAGELTRQDRDDLSAAREDYRLNHRRPATGAAPDSISAGATQGEVG